MLFREPRETLQDNFKHNETLKENWISQIPVTSTFPKRLYPLIIHCGLKKFVYQIRNRQLSDLTAANFVIKHGITEYQHMITY
jgi:hypothetical protein